VCLGFRQEGEWIPYHHLGREVFLVPVQWQEDGWFQAGVHGTVLPEMDMALAAEGEDTCYNVSLNNMREDNPRWCHLRRYDKENYRFENDKVYLRGNQHTLNDVDAPTFLGVRQSEMDTALTVTVGGDAPQAGITFYLSEDHHYDMVLVQKTEGRCVELRFTVGDARCVVKTLELPSGQEQVFLHVKSTGEYYTFFVVLNGEEIFMGKARTKYLSSEVAGGFTGTVMGMFAVDGETEPRWAEFSELQWMMK
jgi:alpha-N-arabinofuranosidase